MLKRCSANCWSVQSKEHPTKAAALKAVEHLRVTINNEIRSPRTFSELTAHYAEES